MTPHRYPDRQSAACVIFASYPWPHLRCEGSEDSQGYGIALWAMNIKSALRDLLSVPYGMISILVISRCAAPPYPAAPDFPPSGGQNKPPRDNLLINSPLEMTVLADTPPSFRPKRSGVEKSHATMVLEALEWEISRLRASWERFPSVPISPSPSARDDERAMSSHRHFEENFLPLMRFP